MAAFLGLDVQAKSCAWATLDEDASMLASGWMEHDPPKELTKLVAELRKEGDELLVGIDAPRYTLPSPRPYYWDGSRRKWRCRRPSEVGWGRHADVVVSAHSLANPQWTPLPDRIPPWMNLGFQLFAALDGVVPTLEVFPSASYSILAGVKNPQLTINLFSFAPGPKDLLDACVAALTVREVTAGRGEEIGGGDGLGRIALPCPIPPEKRIPEVLIWPKNMDC